MGKINSPTPWEPKQVIINKNKYSLYTSVCIQTWRDDTSIAMKQLLHLLDGIFL
jgi:hypothetical protein